MSDAQRQAPTNSVSRSAPEGRAFQLDGASYLKIAAIEGLAPSEAADRRTFEFERLGLSPEERRRAIIEAHRPKR